MKAVDPPVGSCPTWSFGTGNGPLAEDRIRNAKDTGQTNLPPHR